MSWCPVGKANVLVFRQYENVIRVEGKGTLKGLEETRCDGRTWGKVFICK